ncbi:M48 family metallopeptidase [Allobacillus halotolerans]|uniref:M48 family metallopeptidase n=1 Tax=Allobacillus halotolerans TaxID=570278 RepID=A0ABS6GRK5_9BACI|nr:SprT family zinc-dependent metalloprotease [Allobacillus halotolerans]MBU6081294.1 M48 family metallopeptidase [Allobacillus halotolerans]
MPSLKYGTTTIHYCHYKQNRKDIKVSVTLVNGVEVYTPKDISDDQLTEILYKKAPWVTQKLQELNEVKTSVQPKEYVSGEKLPYLGRNYRLKVLKQPVQRADFQFKQGRFIARVPEQWNQDQIQHTLEQKLIQWYRLHGHKKILERADYYQDILGVEPNSLQLRTQHKRWGTCTPIGDIYINWRITMAPIWVIDYVVVHELVHLKIPEHNEKFWRLVKATLPHYEEAKEWLRVHGVELHCVGLKEGQNNRDMTYSV